MLLLLQTRCDDGHPLRVLEEGERSTCDCILQKGDMAADAGPMLTGHRYPLLQKRHATIAGTLAPMASIQQMANLPRTTGEPRLGRALSTTKTKQRPGVVASQKTKPTASSRVAQP